jgi:hypothetical protein
MQGETGGQEEEHRARLLGGTERGKKRERVDCR